jgi:ABC-type transport system involved in Fe-S cluster assembly fused permease/ATPase subunit
MPEILPPFVEDHDLWMALKGRHSGTKATALFLNYRFFEGRAGSTQSSSN